MVTDCPCSTGGASAEAAGWSVGVLATVVWRVCCHASMVAVAAAIKPLGRGRQASHTAPFRALHIGDDDDDDSNDDSDGDDDDSGDDDDNSEDGDNSERSGSGDRRRSSFDALLLSAYPLQLLVDAVSAASDGPPGGPV
ncbi:PREDICTED: late secretory pathway protein AVL9-like [Ipomoea nil]|uniref:late secretory pathway protein AVL9-like n=1 Tax=Ipomoea nil TaxID=35883 RepID=UPI000901E41D|nr:PREDICTED: late secretory pathway protein AVL9-like [Ipomoea nil]